MGVFARRLFPRAFVLLVALCMSVSEWMPRVLLEGRGALAHEVVPMSVSTFVSQSASVSISVIVSVHGALLGAFMFVGIDYMQVSSHL